MQIYEEVIYWFIFFYINELVYLIYVLFFSNINLPNAMLIQNKLKMLFTNYEFHAVSHSWFLSLSICQKYIAVLAGAKLFPSRIMNLSCMQRESPRERERERATVSERGSCSCNSWRNVRFTFSVCCL